ncbi:heat shock protein 27-like [Sitodiplosis mosellana]|uniref:heat shock protein 27-like n=1 Tax=Sitodiplosis mosellana TaxID=263140 RepID=UPI002444C828|nr:heat shock protein 27-like [Sitodiplosis mosellana]
MSSTEPYFFEKYFPSSYHLQFNCPITQYPGSFNLTKDELERKSHANKDEFLVYLDITGFNPEEITVRTMNEMVSIEGRQGRRPGNAIPRSFSRNYRLPDFFDSEDVRATISQDGILQVKALPSSAKKFRHLEEIKAADNVNRFRK